MLEADPLEWTGRFNDSPQSAEVLAIAAAIRDQRRAEPESDLWLSGRGLCAHPDEAVLSALYNATRGANWLVNDNLFTDAPLSEWYGVYTEAEGAGLRGKRKGPLRACRRAGPDRNTCTARCRSAWASSSTWRSCISRATTRAPSIPSNWGNLADTLIQIGLWGVDHSLRGYVRRALWDKSQLTRRNGGFQASDLDEMGLPACSS